MAEILTSIMSMSAWELIATLLSLAYVILAAKGNLWCWPAAFISTLIFAIILFEVMLLMDGVLHIYYMAMAVYGFYQWKKQNNTANSQVEKASVEVHSWSLKKHLFSIALLSLISLAFAYITTNYTEAAYPVIDSFTTVFAIFTTYLVAIKVLENWLYWIVIDAISIYLYINKELYFMSTLFALYTVLAIWGYYEWKKQTSNSKDNDQDYNQDKRLLNLNSG